MSANYYQRGEAIDYTPEADVAAGTIVQIGNLIGVTKLDIPADDLGALALVGVYTLATGGTDVSAGDEVYVDLSAQTVCASTTEGAVKFGYAVDDADTTDATVHVLLVQGLS